MNIFPNKKLQNIFVVLSIFLLHTLLGIYNIILLRPSSIHQWAQCDRASVAINYFHYGMNFFLPRVHNVHNGTGITGMEFPIVNYCVAILYKFFGFHEWFYRLFTLFIYSTGLYFAFKISFWWLKNFWQSLSVMLLFGCSPLLAYYSANFLPEPSSLGIALGAWFFLLKFSDKKEKKYLWLWCIFIFLACLIKVSSLINLPAMILLLWLTDDNKSLKRIISSYLVYFIGIIGVILSWYIYAQWVSNHYKSEMFLLQSVSPKSWADFIFIWSQMRMIWCYRIYNDLLILVMFFSVILGCFLPNLKGKKICYISIVLYISIFTFLLSMWMQLQYHDYYIIPMFPGFLFGMIATVNFINNFGKRVSNILIIVFFLISIGYQFYQSKTHVRISIKKDSWMYSPLYFDNYFELNKVLRKVGIKPEDKIISLLDNTPEISLYLMDQNGVTVDQRNYDWKLKYYMNTGNFNYLVYNKDSESKDRIFSPDNLPLKEIYNNGTIIIYKIIRINS